MQAGAAGILCGDEGIGSLTALAKMDGAPTLNCRVLLLLVKGTLQLQIISVVHLFDPFRFYQTLLDTSKPLPKFISLPV